VYFGTYVAICDINDCFHLRLYKYNLLTLKEFQWFCAVTDISICMSAILVLDDKDLQLSTWEVFQRHIKLNISIQK
jgi:hypothetical protein